jgi:hypothetical protein
MEGLAEWKLANGGWIQVFQDKDRAGSSFVTFLVSGLDDQLAELKAKGISIERTTTSDYVKTATVTISPHISVLSTGCMHHCRSQAIGIDNSRSECCRIGDGRARC